MDKDKKLQEIFEDDPLGLLNIKQSFTPARNEEERLVASFQEIIDFYEKNNRVPELGGSIQEHQLHSRLKSLRSNPVKIEMLKEHDKYGLLDYDEKQYNSLDDIFGDDVFGLLDDDTEGLFDLKNIHLVNKGRAETDFIARRKPCKDFNKYEVLFKSVQKDLRDNKRILLEFRQDNLRAGTYYVHNGVLFLVEKIEITKKEHYKPDGTRVREDGRTRCIFENGTESNMLKRSVEKILYSNGKVVSENVDKVNERFIEHFSNITDEDQDAGYIYILKSKSEKKELKEIPHLYKIGYSKIEVEERIKNAIFEPTYLMAEVRIVMTYKCYNMNPQKFEQLIHNFFGKSCLNLDIYDNVGNRHTPREWFIAPLEIIDQAIRLIISGEIIKYRYDSTNELVVNR
ncbi:MAG: GIY-YIG nuclease family protein [Bacteroidota bacterium]